MVRNEDLISSTAMRADLDELPKDNWHHFLRLRDLHQILTEIPLNGVARVLELGAGDGVQTMELRKRFAEVVSIDIAAPVDVDGIIVADAESLPFVDDYFDLVFSSNVLEHIEQIENSVEEMKRVLTPSGIMIHSMPTGTWKVIQIAARPIASMVKIARTVVSVLSKDIEPARQISHRAIPDSGQPQRSVISKICGQFIPSIHGVSSNHFQEFMCFRTGWWMSKFSEYELNCFRSSPLFLHSPYGMLPYRFLGLRERLARYGIASVQVFWVRAW